jgi:ubiquinone/menaquinone biosynthesis C-methylase UbiE
VSPRGRLALAAGGAALVAGIVWQRRHPSACPYSQRYVIEAPHPLITRARLREALDPRPGERLLEVGPGTGYYTLPVARWVGADGRLDIVDVQQEMLDLTIRRAHEAGLRDVAWECADARTLPYDDAVFDGAFLVTVLGEIPDQAAALSELRRVVRPGGRIVFGEMLLDPHVVPLGRLRERAAAAGMTFERRVGNPVGFFARFAPA